MNTNPGDFERKLERQPLRPLPEAWRTQILDAASAPPGFFSTLHAPRSTLHAQLSTLLWPCPQAWAGLAAIWLTILAVNLATGERPDSLAQAHPAASPELLMVLREQRRELARLIEPIELPPVEPPKSLPPKPRGELARKEACI